MFSRLVTVADEVNAGGKLGPIGGQGGGVTWAEMSEGKLGVILGSSRRPHIRQPLSPVLKAVRPVEFWSFQHPAGPPSAGLERARATESPAHRFQLLMRMVLNICAGWIRGR